MNGRIATSLDTRVHLTTTLGWSDDARAQRYMQELKERADPILHARGWRVLELKEFFPKDTRLLGLNVNRGQEVCVRFRRSNNRDAFFPIEAVIGTMLHELVHCKISPHNKAFWALYHELVQAEEAKDINRAVGGASGAHRLGGGPHWQDRPGASHPLEPRSGLGSTPAPITGQGRRLGGGEGNSTLMATRGFSMSDVLAAAALRRQPTMPPPPSGIDDDEGMLQEDISHLALEGCSQSLCPADRHRRLRAPPTSTGELEDDDGEGVPRTDDLTLPTHSWECPRCHFHNHALLFPVCEMCSDDTGDQNMPLVDPHAAAPTFARAHAPPITYLDDDDDGDDEQDTFIASSAPGTGRKSDPIVL